MRRSSGSRPSADRRGACWSPRCGNRKRSAPGQGRSSRTLTWRLRTPGRRMWLPRRRLRCRCLSRGKRRRRRSPAWSDTGGSITRRWSCGPRTVPTAHRAHRAPCPPRTVPTAHRAHRAQRRHDARVWRALCAARRTAPDRRRRSAPARAAAAAWRAPRVERQEVRAPRVERQEVRAPRRQDDARWQQQRQALHDTPAPAPGARRWIAVLVLTDKCTRHCLGPPLFEAGPTVTAPLVRAA